MSNSKSQSYFVLFFLIGLVVLSLLILWPHFSSLVLAFVLALVCFPIYKKILKVVRFKWLASFLTTFFVLAIILVPLAFLGKLVLSQAYQLYDLLNRQEEVGGLDLVSFIKDKVNLFIPASWGRIDAAVYIKNALGWVVSNLGSIFSSIAQGIMAFVFSLFLLFYLLKDWDELEKIFVSYSPLSYNHTQIIFEKIRNSVNAVVRGSIVVAILQGIVTGFGFFLFGISNPALWGAVAMVAALVPTFGTSLVIIPAVLYLIFSDNLFNAIGLALWGALAVGLLDNFIGPQLVKQKAKVHPILVLLGVLGGVSIFGPMGFIVGPLIFALLFAMLDIYKSIWQDESQIIN